MKLRNFLVTTTVASTLALSGVGFASPVGASSPQPPPGYYHTRITAVSQSLGNESIVAETLVRGSGSGVTQVVAVKPGKKPKGKGVKSVTLAKSGKWYKLGGKRYRVGQRVYQTYKVLNPKTGKIVKRWTSKKNRPPLKLGDKLYKKGKTVTRMQCGNKVKGGKKAPKGRKIKGRIVEVEQFTNSATSTLRGALNSVAEAESMCRVDHGEGLIVSATSGGASSSSIFFEVVGTATAATGVDVRAQARNAARMKLRTKASQQTEVMQSIRTEARSEAYTHVDCGVLKPPIPPPSCPEGSIWDGSTWSCAKDGSTTPPPPVAAPGPNPDPVPGPGDTESSMCYDEVTGMPVDPVDGRCPPGTFGG